MKKLIALFVAITMVISLGMDTFALTSDKIIESETEPSEAQIMQYALNYMRESQNNQSIEISEFIPLFGLDEETTGYYVTFNVDGLPAGYLLISLLTSGCPVVELSFEGAGLLEATMEQATQMSMSAKAEERKLIYTGPDALFVPTRDNQYFSIYDQAKVTVAQIEDIQESYMADSSVAETNGGVNIYDGILDWGPASVNSNSIFKIRGFGAGTDYWLMTDFSKGGVCYPTTGTNILWYWGFKRGCTSVSNKYYVAQATSNKAKASAIFNTLYHGMGTIETGVVDGTLDTNVTQGFEYFFDTPAESGGVWNYKKISNGSSYYTYCAALNDECPIFLVIKNGTGLFAEGHGVYNFGYARSTSGDNYLFVMDGWYNYGRFLKFDYYPKIFGYKIWVR